MSGVRTHRYESRTVNWCELHVTPRKIYRSALIVIALMLAGCALTFGSAWGAALWEQRENGVFHRQTPFDKGGWLWSQTEQSALDESQRVLFMRPPKNINRIRTCWRLGTSMRFVEENEYVPNREWTFGVPVPCLTMNIDGWPMNGYPRGRYPEPWRDGWSVELSTPRFVNLPLRPRWWAFAIDLIVWSGGTWLAASALWRWRRKLRGKRGACRACGYDLSGISAEVVCPECGRDP